MSEPSRDHIAPKLRDHGGNVARVEIQRPVLDMSYGLVRVEGTVFGYAACPHRHPEVKPEQCLGVFHRPDDALAILTSEEALRLANELVAVVHAARHFIVVTQS